METPSAWRLCHLILRGKKFSRDTQSHSQPLARCWVCFLFSETAEFTAMCPWGTLLLTPSPWSLRSRIAGLCWLLPCLPTPQLLRVSLDWVVEPESRKWPSPPDAIPQCAAITSTVRSVAKMHESTSDSGHRDAVGRNLGISVKNFHHSTIVSWAPTFAKVVFFSVGSTDWIQFLFVCSTSSCPWGSAISRGSFHFHPHWQHGGTIPSLCLISCYPNLPDNSHFHQSIPILINLHWFL